MILYVPSTIFQLNKGGKSGHFRQVLLYTALVSFMLEVTYSELIFKN